MLLLLKVIPDNHATIKVYSQYPIDFNHSASNLNSLLYSPYYLGFDWFRSGPEEAYVCGCKVRPLRALPKPR